MSRPRAGRDFVLDSGGLTALAAPTQLADAWLDFIAKDFDGAAVHVPRIVVVEATTQSPADTNVNRFLKAVDDPDRPGRFWLEPSPDDYKQAAALRTEVIRGGATPSAADALIAAGAVRLSQKRAVTIITSDLGDMTLLVDVSRQTNIAVQLVDQV